MDIARFLLNSIEDTIYILENYYYFLISTLEILITYHPKILVIVSSKEEEESLAIKLPDSVDISRELKNDYTYDYIFVYNYKSVGYKWNDYTNRLVVAEGVKGKLIKEPKIPLITDIQVNRTYFFLDQLGLLYHATAKEVARMAYTSPQSLILILAPSPIEVESISNLLIEANLPLPLIDIQSNLQQGIIVTTRNVGLLNSSFILPDYIYDTGIKNRYISTWTCGCRNRPSYLTEREANEVLAFGTGTTLHRMAPNLLSKTPSFCLKGNTLGPRTQQLLNLWQREIFPMTCLVSLIDSFDGTYFLNDKSIDKFMGPNDLVTLLNIFLELMDYSGGFDNTPLYIEEWSEVNGLNKDKLIEVYYLIESLLPEGTKKGPFNPINFIDSSLDVIDVVYGNRIIDNPSPPIYVSKLSTRKEEGALYSIIIRDNLIWLALPVQLDSTLETINVITIEEGFPEDS